MITKLSSLQSIINRYISICNLVMVINHTDKVIQELGMSDNGIGFNIIESKKMIYNW